LLQKLIKKIERQSPDKDKLEQIRKNLEILKTLEAEYIAEQKSRDDLNEELQKEGFSSLEDKIKHMHEVARKTAESAKNEGLEASDDQSLGSFSGSAVCGFKPNE
jgi:rubrerythrin